MTWDQGNVFEDALLSFFRLFLFFFILNSNCYEKTEKRMESTYIKILFLRIHIALTFSGFYEGVSIAKLNCHAIKQKVRIVKDRVYLGLAKGGN